MNRGGQGLVLVTGGEPRVSLLPTETRLQKKAKALRRTLVLSLAALAVVLIAAAGGSGYLAAQSQSQLDASNNETTSILAQQSKFKAVGIVSSQLALVKAARAVGSSTEMDLRGYLRKVQGVLPAGVSLLTFAVDSGTPMTPYTQATVPLQPSRVATLTFTASTPSAADLPRWLDGLATLPGFADATPGTVQLDKGVYQASVVMHVDEGALAHRFVSEKGVVR